jgi:hypothetical protein
MRDRKKARLKKEYVARGLFAKMGIVHVRVSDECDVLVMRFYSRWKLMQL